ncbi:MAG TPA: AMP-binding protein, partial [Myxococcota bacterium]|nr:AMP-binding protein [Myxococcota bacterium]
MSLNLSLLLHESARAHAARPALHMGDMTMSYAQLQGMVRRFAGVLRGLGVQPGQHVALLLPNTPHFPISYFGILHAGNVVVPLNVLLTADEIAYHLEDSDSVVLVAWEGFAAQAIEAVGRVPTCRHLLVVKAGPTDTTAPEGALSFNALLGGAKPLVEYHPTMPDDRAVILYTSGTTGKPKGAELTHFNLFYNAEYVCRRLIPGDHSRVALAVLPLFHSFGQTAVQNATLALGGSLVLLPRFDAATAFALMHKHKVTLFAGVPTMYFGLLHFPEADKYDLSSLTICVSGGAAMPVEVMRAFDHKYRVNILEGFGLSETSPVASFNVLDRPKKAGSIGLPIWGVEFRLVDNDGKVVEGAGERGEIHIKGHNLMRGYYKRPEATADAIVDG